MGIHADISCCGPLTTTKLKSRNPNVEQEILNDEVKSLLLFPSAFVIRYSIFCGSPSGGFVIKLLRIMQRSSFLKL